MVSTGPLDMHYQENELVAPTLHAATTTAAGSNFSVLVCLIDMQVPTNSEKLMNASLAATAAARPDTIQVLLASMLQLDGSAQRAVLGVLVKLSAHPKGSACFQLPQDMGPALHLMDRNNAGEGVQELAATMLLNVCSRDAKALAIFTNHPGGQRSIQIRKHARNTSMEPILTTQAPPDNLPQKGGSSILQADAWTGSVVGLVSINLREVGASISAFVDCFRITQCHVCLSLLQKCCALSCPC